MKNVFLGVLFFCAVGANAQQKWSLRECVDYALKNNLEVIRNEYSKKIQDNQLQIAKREYLPSVSGNIGNNASFGQQRYINEMRRNDNFTNSVSVGADMLVFNYGRLDKNVRRVEFEVEATKYDVETIKNNISLQIAQQYLSALLNKEIVKISASAVENAQRVYDRAKITTEVGTTAKTVLAEAEASLAREKQSLKNAEINTQRSLFSLAQLLQLDDYKNFDVVEVPLESIEMVPLYTSDDILNKAFESQPQMKASEYRIKSAEMQTEVAKTAFWPMISLSAGVGTSYFNQLSSSINENFFKQYSNNFTQQVGVSANIPIFNKGITRLQVEQAKINEDIAKIALKQSRQDVLKNVQQAQFDAESNYENYLSAQEAEKSAKLALEFAEKSYQAGRSTIYELNAARNNYANAQGNVAQAKYNYLFSLKMLDFYAGIPLSL